MWQRRNSDRPAKKRVHADKRKGAAARKGRRRDSGARKRKGASGRPTPSGAADLKKLLDQRRRERDEALEQQAATVQALEVLSRSHLDLQTVLDTRSRELAEALQQHAATADILNMSHELRAPAPCHVGLHRIDDGWRLRRAVRKDAGRAQTA